jgi:hypothetical protein
MPHPDPENADLLAALGYDLPESLRFRNGLAPWERFVAETRREQTLNECLAEAVNKATPPPFIYA